MSSESSLSRRDLLGRAAAAGLLAGPASGLLAACATSGGDDDKSSAKQGEKTKDNPLGVPTDAALDVVIFKGGFGDDYAKFDEQLYKKKYPKASIKHSGIQQIQQELQPRFVGGNPPDVIDNSGAQQMDTAALVSDKQVMDLADLLDAPSIDDPDTKIRDTLLPGTVEVGSYGDKMYVLNYAYTVYGLWYSKSLMDKHGWEYPQTWDAMLSLCADIKKAKIAPWTYQGKFPVYMNWPILMMAAKNGGADILKAIDNLEPNAWKHPAIKAAAEAFYELAAKGYIMPGTAGLTHIESQTAWTQSKAVFITCGSWLENEAKPTTPANFQMTCAPVPSLGSDDKIPFAGLRATAGEPFIVPSKGKNPYGGMEFLRVMLSKQASANFAKTVSSLTCLRDGTEGVTLTPGLASAKQAVDAAGPNAFNWLYEGWYKKLSKEMVAVATGELMTKKITPDEWVKRCQDGADQIAKDDTIKKFKRS